MEFNLQRYPDILTVKDVQEILCIGRNSVYNLLTDNKIKHFQVGHVYKIPKVYLLQYIKKTCGD